MKKSFLFALTLLLCSMQVSAYTFYFHPGSWAGTYAKYAVLSWSDNYDEAVYSDFMTPVAGHEGWFSTSVPDGNNEMYVCAYPSEATTSTEGAVNWSYQLSESGTYTYYYFNVGYMEDFDGKLVGADRILSGNIIYSVNDEEHTAEVYGDQGSMVIPNNELIIPSSFTWKTTTYTVTSIAASAYMYSGIESVSLPNTLLHIGDAAFHSSGLTSVTIPSSVTSIDDGAFALCGALSSVTLEEGLTALGTQMFQYDHNLTEITVPNSIRDLPAGVFSYCEGLRSVTLGEGVDTIGDNAFVGSNSLARLTIYAPAPPKVNLEENPALVSTCSLMVPSSVKAAYEAHDYWKNFGIKGIYIVTFKDFSGNTIKTEAVEEGQAAEAPEAPNREEEGYDFIGWDVAFNNVTTDLVVNAVYEIKHFTVRFLNIAGEPIKTETVDWDNNATAPAAPEVEGHHFVAWDPADFTHIKADLDVQATYAINQYTVKFFGWNDELLDTQVIDWSAAAIAPADPEHEGYDFKGWDTDFSSVKSDLDVKAKFEIKHFTVRFLDIAGEPIKTETVDWDNNATAPAAPEVEGHHFVAWDPADFTHIRANLDVQATYAINQYTVTFLDWDGSNIEEPQLVNWHAAAIAPADPEREGYKFLGWDTDFSSVEANLEVTATYEKLTYRVVFMDWDGTVLKAEQIVEWGAAAVAPEATPHRDYYTFNGWDTDFSSVKADLVVTATYLPGENAEVKVIFLDPEDETNELASSDVVIRIPAAPEIVGYTFLGWRPKAAFMHGQIEIEAVYESNDPTAAPEVYTNPANPAQKLIRDGQVYILRDDRTYTINGQLVK